jgi:Mg2+/Co2+ transporter CorC
MMGAVSMMQSKSQNSSDASSYYVDSLLRSNHPKTAVDQDTKDEVAHILAKGMKDGSLSDADKTYLAQLISIHTGLALPDAEKKIDTMVAEVRQSADEARKTAASVSIYTFLSMLIGAFIASAAAALGGQERDKPYPRLGK